MRRALLWAGIVAGLVVLIWLLRATVFAPDAIPVEVAAVERGRVEETVTNSRAGTVRARRRARMTPEVGGQVREVGAREGERVEAGAVLLALDDVIPSANLALAERQHQAAVAEAERACLAAARAAREAERLARLAREALLSVDQADAAESNRETAAAGCTAARAVAAQAEAAVRAARAELARMTLRAPFAGVLAEVSTEIGEWVTPAPPLMQVPAVVDLYDPQSIYVSAPMDEVDAARLKPELPARITVDSHRGRTFAGRVTRVARYVLDVQEQNRTVEIDVAFADPEFAATLLPGTSADVVVILDARENVLRIPTAALLQGDHVLVLEDGRLVERPVEVGLGNWDFTEVVSGLEPEDRVVTSLDREEVRAGARAVVSE
ncbi:MAG: efflux RND transporter periplasmic adaptor subunit [Thermoanaerobaculia bacterium]